MRITNKSELETRTLRKLLTSVKNKICKEEGRNKTNLVWKTLHVYVREDPKANSSTWLPTADPRKVVMVVRRAEEVPTRKLASAFEQAFLRFALRMKYVQDPNVQHPQWEPFVQKFGVLMPVRPMKEPKAPPTPVELAEKKVLRAQRMLHRWQLRAAKASSRVMSWSKRVRAAEAAALKARASVPQIASAGIERKTVGKRHIKLQGEA
jgi:hypothetical protein